VPAGRGRAQCCVVMVEGDLFLRVCVCVCVCVVLGFELRAYT
jgi:hypothetical protein